MSGTDDPLASFVFEPGLGWWQAHVAVPLWGGTLPISIDAPASGPSPRQAATLRAVLAYPRSLREAVGQALLSHYNDEWGCCTPSLGDAPPLASVNEVWPAMSAVGLHIPAFRSEAGEAAFEFHMDSEWDEDHGLCVLIRDWAVIRVAGQTDCRGVDA
jgi:hypothetical protein